jgi:thiamine biosynthesis lipoprotein
VRELHGEGLGSTWSVKLAGPVPRDLSDVQRGVQERVDTIAHQLSRWDSDSALSLLNASPSSDWQSLPPELFTALSYALSLAADTGGAYDPTVAPLVDAWGFGTRGRRYEPPSQTDVAAARALVGWEKVELDAASHRVRRPTGTVLDLSSMTHGFAADQVATYLRSVGLQRHLVDVGSEMRASGDSPEGHPWRVAIERPPPESGDAAGAEVRSSASTDAARGAMKSEAQCRGSNRGGRSDNAGRADNAGRTDDPSDGDALTEVLCVVGLRDAGIATSGNYRYYFDYNGRRFSHRIDPRTAEPVTHPLASVTVIASEGLHADALATALTVLGPDAGFDYAQRNDIAALFVVRTAEGFEQRMTPRFAAYVD